MVEYISSRERLTLNKSDKLALNVAQRLCNALECKGMKKSDGEIALFKNKNHP